MFSASDNHQFAILHVQSLQLPVSQVHLMGLTDSNITKKRKRKNKEMLETSMTRYSAEPGM